MNQEEALALINVELGLGAAITHKGDQIKCYTRDLEEGGVSKTYLNELECMRISLAFLQVSNALRAATNAASQEPSKAGGDAP